MSTDRVVRWKGRKPTGEQVSMVLEDFVGTAADVDYDGERWYVTFRSVSSWPLHRVADCGFGGHETRWIEVWEDDERTGVWVITRMQDEFVSALADRLADVFARYWQGELE